MTFSGNGTNAAQNTTATLASEGVYEFTVTVRDAGGNAVASTLTVTVPAPAATSVATSPATIHGGE